MIPKLKICMMVEMGREGNNFILRVEASLGTILCMESDGFSLLCHCLVAANLLLN